MADVIAVLERARSLELEIKTQIEHIEAAPPDLEARCGVLRIRAGDRSKARQAGTGSKYLHRPDVRRKGGGTYVHKLPDW